MINLNYKKNDTEISLLRTSDIEWYLDIIFQPFFYKYMGYTPKIETDYDKIKSNLLKSVASYKIGNIARLDERYVIKKDGKNVGGITLINTNIAKVIELAYWVVPEAQGNGLCTNVMSEVIKKLTSKKRRFHTIKLHILEDNIASTRIAEKLGFERIGMNADKVIYVIEL